jgi:DNA polymerase elongation subunit (family B)
MTIYLFDFQSLYPNCFISGNLFTPTKDGWNGSIIFPSEITNEEDGIKGTYSKQQGEMEKLLIWLFKERKKIPKSDPRNLAYKIVLNVTYGITGCAKFKSIYNLTTASDCTALARRCIKYARYRFIKSGYECIYTDTDSIFIKDKFNNEEKILKLAQDISEEERKGFNIYSDTHNLALETKINKMWFFRDNNGKFIKKHYIYLNNKNELIIKGIKIKQGNCSKIALKFYEEQIKQKFISNTYQPYHASDLLKELKEYSIGKEELLLKRYRVDTPESYKISEGKEESTSIHYNISKKYGAGEHWLIINKRIGVGKGNKYCKLEELKDKYGEHYIDQICFEEYLKDLSEFIIWNERNKLHNVDRKRVINETKTLES